MFKYGLKLTGAAAATIIAQYVGLLSYLFLLLRSKKSPISTEVKEKNIYDGMGRMFKRILSANLAMIVRNGTLLTTWAIATAVATRIGVLDVAAHQVRTFCFITFFCIHEEDAPCNFFAFPLQVVLSVWLFAALITESPAIAAQVCSPYVEDKNFSKNFCFP